MQILKVLNPIILKENGEKKFVQRLLLYWYFKLWIFIPPLWLYDKKEDWHYYSSSVCVVSSAFFVSSAIYISFISQILTEKQIIQFPCMYASLDGLSGETFYHRLSNHRVSLLCESFHASWEIYEGKKLFHTHYTYNPFDSSWHYPHYPLQAIAKMFYFFHQIAFVWAFFSLWQLRTGLRDPSGASVKN